MLEYAGSQIIALTAVYVVKAGILVSWTAGSEACRLEGNALWQLWGGRLGEVRKQAGLRTSDIAGAHELHVGACLGSSEACRLNDCVLHDSTHALPAQVTAVPPQAPVAHSIPDLHR